MSGIELPKQYAIATDADCLKCGIAHGYATQNCTLVVFTHFDTAAWFNEKVKGKIVEIDLRDMEPIPYILNVWKGGRRDPALPAGVSSIRA